MCWINKYIMYYFSFVIFYHAMLCCGWPSSVVSTVSQSVSQRIQGYQTMPINGLLSAFDLSLHVSGYCPASCLYHLKVTS